MQRDHPPSRPGDPAAHRQGLLRLRPGRPQARARERLVDKIGDGRARRAHAPDRRRGPHRLAADLERRATRPTGTSPALAPRRSSTTSSRTASSPAGMSLRGYGRQRADRHQFDARTAVPRTGGSRSSSPASTPPTRSQSSARRRIITMVKKLIPVIVAARRARRRLQVRARQAGKEAEAKPKVEGTVYMLGKEFLVNLADGRFAKLHGRARARARRHVDRAPPAARGAATPPEGFGAMTQEAVVRDVITDDLTDAKDNDLISRERSRGAQGGDPQGPQEAHRCKGRGRPVHRRHRSVGPHGRDRRLRPLRDHHGRPRRAGGSARRSRPRSSSACTTCRSSSRSRSAARR